MLVLRQQPQKQAGQAKRNQHATIDCTKTILLVIAALVFTVRHCMKQDTKELTSNDEIYWLRLCYTRYILVQQGKTYRWTIGHQRPDGAS
jgi:hypothetical protein